MMFGFWNKRNQKAGDNSTNVNVENINVQGLTVSEVREIALDIFKSNFYDLSDSAAKQAVQRAEYLVDKFINKLQEETPENIQNMNDPDMQYTLFTAQQGFARCGEEELGDQLVQLLVDRTNEGSRSLKQIVLNEAISIFPKITKKQLNILTLVFLYRSVNFGPVNSIEAIAEELKKHFNPFFLWVPIGSHEFLHLDYLGCINMDRLPKLKYIDILKEYYPGLFLGGFSQSDFINYYKKHNISMDIIERLLVVTKPCLQDENLLQFDAVKEEVLEVKMASNAIDYDVIQQSKRLYNQNIMDNDRAEHFISEFYPEYQELNRILDSYPMNKVALTPVGVALAYSNLKQTVGVDIDLNAWIQ